MVRFEKDKLVIEMETYYPADSWVQAMHDLIRCISIADKERMDIIDRCYTDMLQYRSLVQYYTNKNIGVSYLRAKKQNDLDRVMALYGSPNERYW